MKESQFQQKLKKMLEDEGALVFNVHGHLMQQGGWPDLQVYHWIWTGHLELKIQGRILDARQRKIGIELQKRQTAVFCLSRSNEIFGVKGLKYEIEIEDMSHNVLGYSEFQGKALLEKLRVYTHRFTERR